MTTAATRTGFGAYLTLLSDRTALAFSVAGFVARLPVSMTGLSIVLLISLITGSYGQAGIVTACATLTGAVAAPWWGRRIDRLGQGRVLVIAALICNLSLTVLLITVLVGLPLWITCLAAVGVGLGYPSAGSAVRARWSHRLRDSPLLGTAFAFEAIVDEVVFIVGPVLATFVATSIHPALGLVSCVVLGLAGAFALAAQRGSQPPVADPADPVQVRPALSAGRLIPIVLACAALGMLFGGMEVVIVAFADAAGILPFAGFIVMAWAAGSLISAVITGAIAWRVTPARRFRIGAALLAASMVPLLFVQQPVVVALLLVLSGLAIAPTLIATVSVTQESVPGSRLTEALGWTSTGMAAGVAAGAAGLGQLIDHFGAPAGFLGAVGIGLLLVIAAVFVRDPARTTPLL
ncbi:MFS transporter [Microlunatus speluncae]|uniref:MFS transporter n=1 Tax=Microlunatus speluncae TaxID=2594267 RepID=UPI0012665B88|nr:MFS transporter [Microlunatus speluncae]